MEKFIPVIVGSDMNAYIMMTAFHEAYNKKSIIVSKSVFQFTQYTTLKKDVYQVNNLEDPNVFLGTLKKVYNDYHEQAENLLLIGTNDKYQNLIIDYQEELASYFTFNVVKKEVRDALYEKKAFYKTCEKYGLPIPKTHYYSCKSSDPFSGEVTFPVIVKPSNGVNYYKLSFEGQEKVYKIKNNEELHRVISRIKTAGYQDELIIQDYIPGDDTQMFDAVYYANTNGEPQLITFGQVVSQEPQGTAIGNYNAILAQYNREVMDQIVSFLSELNYTGFANVDLKYDRRDNTFKIFEVNLRQGRSSFYSIASGKNLAQYLVEDLIDNKTHDIIYMQKDFLFSVVPIHLLRRHVDNKHVLDEINKCVKNKQYRNPIYYSQDLTIKMRLYLMLRQLNMYKKYQGKSFN